MLPLANNPKVSLGTRNGEASRAGGMMREPRKTSSLSRNGALRVSRPRTGSMGHRQMARCSSTKLDEGGGQGVPFPTTPISKDENGNLSWGGSHASHTLWATGGTASPYQGGNHSLLDSGKLTEEKEIILVRHGESTWNVEGRIQGNTDISTLTEMGEEQARLVQDALSSIPFDSCFSSPITRARRSAEIIWEGRDSEIIFLEDLEEADLLTLQGMLNTDAAVKYPELFRTWRETPHLFCVDGVYPVKHQWTRAASAWKTILESPGNQHLVITHKSILRAMVCTALGLPPAGFRAVDIHNSGVTRIRVNKDGEAMLSNLNLTTHMYVPNVKY